MSNLITDSISFYTSSKQAKKVCMIIEKLYSLTKSRFMNRFTIDFIDVNASTVPNINLYLLLSVSVWRDKKSGDMFLQIYYLKAKPNSGQIIDSYIYHRRLLHEYGEVFLFHNDLFNSPNTLNSVSGAKRNVICDQFADFHLGLAQ